MATPPVNSSFGSYSSRSGFSNPVRVSVYINGAGAGAAGRRVVLDRDDPLSDNVSRMSSKLQINTDKCSNPKVYTKTGIEVDDMEDIIEGEVLFFEPRGLPFQTPGGGSSKSRSSFVETSVGSTSVGQPSQHSRGRPKEQLPVPRNGLVRGNSFEYDYLFKFILVGSVSVGKSCLLLRFTDQRFRPTHETTIGVDFGTETIRVRGNKRIKIQIWDTAGQEYFKAITRAYFREAAAALIVYDVTNRKSFDDIKQWLDNVKSTSTNRSLTITLIGNKSDRPAESRVISEREGQTFARDNGLLFLETSALSGDNVHEAFARTADAVLRKLDSGQIDVDDPSQGVRRGEFNVDFMALGGGSKMNVPSRQNYNMTVNGNSLGTESDDGCYC